MPAVSSCGVALREPLCIRDPDEDQAVKVELVDVLLGFLVMFGIAGFLLAAWLW